MLNGRETVIINNNPLGWGEFTSIRDRWFLACWHLAPGVPASLFCQSLSQAPDSQLSLSAPESAMELTSPGPISNWWGLGVSKCLNSLSSGRTILTGVPQSTSGSYRRISSQLPRWDLLINTPCTGFSSSLSHLSQFLSCASWDRFPNKVLLAGSNVN